MIRIESSNDNRVTGRNLLLLLSPGQRTCIRIRLQGNFWNCKCSDRLPCNLLQLEIIVTPMNSPSDLWDCSDGRINYQLRCNESRGLGNHCRSRGYEFRATA